MSKWIVCTTAHESYQFESELEALAFKDRTPGAFSIYEKREEDTESESNPVWNGEGLPPVGTECEWKDNDKWLKVEVVFSSRWVIVIRSKENNPGFGVDEAIDLVKDKSAYLSFRPIRTEAERQQK